MAEEKNKGQNKQPEKVIVKEKQVPDLNDRSESRSYSNKIEKSERNSIGGHSRDIVDTTSDTRGDKRNSKSSKD